MIGIEMLQIRHHRATHKYLDGHQINDARVERTSLRPNGDENKDFISVDGCV